MVVLKSYQFWVLAVGLVSYVIGLFVPDFPLTQENILAVVLFVLAAFGIKPELQARGLL